MKYINKLICGISVVLTVLACEKQDTSSYPPIFDDMVFVSEAGLQLSELAVGEKVNVILAMKEGGHNVTNPTIEWSVGNIVVVKRQLHSMEHRTSFTVPASLEAGNVLVTAKLIYGVAGQDSRQMSDYRTDKGLEVSYTQAYAGVVGHYELSASKRMKIVAPSNSEE